MYKVYRTSVCDEGKYPVLVEVVNTYEEAEQLEKDIIKEYAEYDFTEDDIFICYNDEI